MGSFNDNPDRRAFLRQAGARGLVIGSVPSILSACGDGLIEPVGSPPSLSASIVAVGETYPGEIQFEGNAVAVTYTLEGEGVKSVERTLQLIGKNGIQGTKQGSGLTLPATYDQVGVVGRVTAVVSGEGDLKRTVQYDTQVMDSDELVALFTRNDRDPESPSLRVPAFLSLLDPKYGTVRRVVEEGRVFHSGMSWSPDGRYLAYSDSGNWGDIHVYDRLAGEVRRLTRSGNLFNRSPVWSNDGNTLWWLTDARSAPESYFEPVFLPWPSTKLEVEPDGFTYMVPEPHPVWSAEYMAFRGDGALILGGNSGAISASDVLWGVNGLVFDHRIAVVTDVFGNPSRGFIEGSFEAQTANLEAFARRVGKVGETRSFDLGDGGVSLHPDGQSVIFSLYWPDGSSWVVEQDFATGELRTITDGGNLPRLSRSGKYFVSRGFRPDRIVAVADRPGDSLLSLSANTYEGAQGMTNHEAGIGNT